MDEENSTAPVDTSADTPAPDVVNDILSDTEDNNTVIPEQSEEPKEVEETPSESNEDAPEAEAEPEAEPKTEDDEGLQPELDPKEEARLRYQERQRAKDETRQRIQQQTQEYIQEGEDENEQRMRSVEAQQYAQTVEHTQNTLIGEFERVKANPDLQIFNPENKEMFNERAYDKALRDYNAAYIQYDNMNNPVGVKASLFDHLTETAELLKDSVKSGQIQQVRATRNMRTNADTKPAAQPKESQKDPIHEVFLSD